MLRVGRFSEVAVNDVKFTINGKSLTLPVKNNSVDTPKYAPIYKEKQNAQTAYIRLESFMPNGTKASEINFEKFMTSANRYLSKSNVIVDLRTNTGIL